MTFVNWKTAGCLAIAGMLMLPLAAEAKTKATKGHRNARHATLRLADLPHAAAAAIRAEKGVGRVTKIVKVAGTGKASGRTYYLASVTKGRQHSTIKVSATGKVVKHASWHRAAARTGRVRAHKAA